MKRKNSVLMRLLSVLLLLSLTCGANAQEKVRLQLKWRHAFQFAGYYAALEKGYYKDAGLDVEIVEGTPKTHTTEEVLSGRAHYGVGTSSLILERKAGKPVVVIANIFQHSPQILIARKFSENQTIHDLIGRRLMLEPQSEELLAYLKAEGVPLSALRIQAHSFTVDDLQSQRTDVISAYSISEPYHLAAAAVPFQIFTPRSAGIDFYGDNLFTSESEIAQHSERAKALCMPA
jgi:ABC-type nitrate/sulfonate/bicarbonate transport system substrate-binding protein